MPSVFLSTILFEKGNTFLDKQAVDGGAHDFFGAWVVICRALDGDGVRVIATAAITK